MDDRLQRLHSAIGKTQLAFNQSSVGRDTQIADRAQGPPPRPDDRPRPGSSRSMSKPTRPPATMLDVTLVSAGPNSLAGAVRQAEAA